MKRIPEKPKYISAERYDELEAERAANGWKRPRNQCDFNVAELVSAYRQGGKAQAEATLKIIMDTQVMRDFEYNVMLGRFREAIKQLGIVPPKTGILDETRLAPLYHTMSSAKTFDVLKRDMMPARWEHDIPGLGKRTGNSFSRNPKLTFAEHYPVMLVVDQARLAQTNKIIPLNAEFVHRYTYTGKYSSNFDDRKMHKAYGDQFAEEFVLGDIKALHRYVREIRIINVEDSYANMMRLLDIVYDYGSKFNINVNINSETHQILNSIKPVPEDEE